MATLLERYMEAQMTEADRIRETLTTIAEYIGTSGYFDEQ